MIGAIALFIAAAWMFFLACAHYWAGEDRTAWLSLLVCECLAVAGSILVRD